MNFAAIVDRNARRMPDLPALIDSGTMLTYAAFQGRLAAAAWHMRERGVRPGDIVMIALPSGLLTTVMFFAAIRLGAAACNVDWRARGAERDALVAALDPRLILVDRPSSQRGESRAVVPTADWERMPAGAAPPSLAPATGPAFLLLSSGTTGRPKAIAVSHEATMWRAMLRAFEIRLLPGQRCLTPIPLTATTAIHSMLGQILAGATAYQFPALYSPEELLEALQRHRINHTSLVPTVVRWMLECPWNGKPLLADMLTFRVVGAAFHQHERIAAMQRISPNLHESYGAAGAGFICAATPSDIVHRPGSVGLASTSVTVEIVDEHNRVLPIGQIGRIRVKSPTLASGYVGGTGELERDEVFREGYSFPGDLGRLDADGYIYLEGRASSMIIRGGQNIYPNEIEGVLLAHPAVAEAAVIARPDARLGEVPVALLILRAEATEVELSRHCRSRLQNHKVPAEFHIVQSLPRNATGKIQRSALPDLLPPPV